MYRAMSIANAIRVRRAAINERSDANRASVTCDERENRRAIKVTPAAAVGTHQHWESASTEDRDMPTGCTAKPRVAPGPMVTFSEADMSCTE
jgi:hypothetical protein